MAVTPINREQPAIPPLVTAGESEPRLRLIHRESQWQTAPKLSALPDGRLPRIGLARWSGTCTDQPLEMSSDHIEGSHFITYSLRQADIDFAVGRQPVTAGTVQSQRVLLQGPTSERRRCVYHNDFDFFRVYFPQAVLAECFEAIYHRSPASEIALFGPHFNEDPVIESLTRSLVSVDDEGGLAGPTFVDSVGLALAARLIGHYAGQPSGQIDRKPSPLVKWRLNRVVAYVEDQLSHPIYLAELSSVAGLSRMHFAAQFRAATGYPPHTYILRRRIARAQQLLRDRSMSLADVALIAGFQNQAHFTTVFKRMVGETPGRWRGRVLG